MTDDNDRLTRVVHDARVRGGDVGRVVGVLAPLADGAGQRAGARARGRAQRAQPGGRGAPRRGRATQTRVYTHAHVTPGPPLERDAYTLTAPALG